jgi:predicted ArsR family transcriptional regulator
MNKGLLLAVTVALGSTACDEARNPSDADAGAESFALTREASASFASALEDVRLRILPALSDDSGGDSLNQALDAVGHALLTKETTALRNALLQAETAMVELSEDEAYDALAPDLEAVRLILVAARELLPGSIQDL